MLRHGREGRCHDGLHDGGGIVRDDDPPVIEIGERSLRAQEDRRLHGIKTVREGTVLGQSCDRSATFGSRRPDRGSPDDPGMVRPTPARDGAASNTGRWSSHDPTANLTVIFALVMILR
jgi:hypothetical protein